MELLLKFLFYLSGFIIVWAMAGYPLSLKLIGKLYKDRQLKKDYSHKPTVTVMVAAHNEEKVILEKLQNMMDLDYEQDKIEFLITSDNSTDKTNEIVMQFIKEHGDKKIRLYEVQSRKGKTNAQNEAQKTISTEYLVMTDANSIMDKKSVKELMAAFTSEDIAYVSGKLIILNKNDNYVSKAESNYWNIDIVLREIEGRIQTITAGNGAIYACRNKDYHDFDPLEGHDIAMPLFYALQGKRAIYNQHATAYEKAGNIISDEFSRKARMNILLLKYILPDAGIINIFKYRWFSFFYFGHRTCRYLLWISHLLLLVSNSFLLMASSFYVVTFIFQVLFYLLSLLRALSGINIKFLNMAYYYCVAVVAQWVGVINYLSGKAKPYWEKAESTR